MSNWCKSMSQNAYEEVRCELPTNHSGPHCNAGDLGWGTAISWEDSNA